MCPHCNSELPEAATFCPACGAATPTDEGHVTHESESAQRDHRVRLQEALGDAYQLRELIGEGGFGAVYRAVDLKLKREVAVKVIRAELLASQASMERFQREAQAVAQLRHPNVIPIYNVGEAAGLTYFVMPLITGVTLRAALDRGGPLPIDEVVRILGEISGALEAAHRTGLVHRDIKPDNVMLEGDEQRALLMDFGVAKALEVGDPELTASGALVGTPLYMSPEQASGESHIDHRADIYSLGVVAFQMLTGETPFTGDTARAVIAKHITDEAPPILPRRAECPPSLSDAVARCLAKDPGDRWDTAGALLAALRAVSPLGGAVRATEPSADYPIEVVASAVLHPAVRRVRWGAVGYLGITAAAFAVDLMDNASVDFAPMVLVAGAFLVAGFYGSLVTAGLSWRDVLSPGQGALNGAALKGSGRAATPTDSDSADTGSHGVVVHQVRHERAAMVAVIASLPKSERQRLADVLPAVDRLIARTVEIARRLHQVDQRMANEREKLQRSQDAIRDTAGGVWDLRGALAERQEKTMEELRRRRKELTELLRESAASVYEVGDAVAQAKTSGVSASIGIVRDVLNRASTSLG